MHSTDSEADDKQRQDGALKDVRALNEEGLSFGLPSFLFFGGIALSAAIAFILPWFIGLLFGAVYFITMYRIHADDPKALPAWMEALSRPQRWSAAARKDIRVYFLVGEE